MQGREARHCQPLLLQQGRGKVQVLVQQLVEMKKSAPLQQPALLFFSPIADMKPDSSSVVLASHDDDLAGGVLGRGPAGPGGRTMRSHRAAVDIEVGRLASLPQLVELHEKVGQF